MKRPLHLPDENQMSAEILSTHTPALFNVAVKRAADLLRAGELVALPTETVYGLAANALDAKAVAKIFEVKGRPSHNPVIVHVADAGMARQCTAHWPESADALARSFWPGPLTMVLPRAVNIPDVVTAGGSTVGVRWPGHPFIQAVIRECGFPLAAPSANRSNSISPTNAQHVVRQLGDRLRLIVDGGQSQVGIESTVVDLVSQPPRMLRPGMIHEESLVAVIGKVSVGESQAHVEGALRSPGLLKKHYAPRARLTLLKWGGNEDFEKKLAREESGVPRSKIQVIAHTHIPSTEGFAGVSVIPHDAEAFARAIYAELHRCDEAGVERIIVEALPDSIEWRAVADRLNRAAAG